MILITGSAGLLGRHIANLLGNAGKEVRHFDVATEPLQDVRNRARLREAMEKVDGVIHLAAISRVVWGERDPELTHEVNVGGIENVLSFAGQSPNPPWVIFASSREVYGEASTFPVSEDAGLSPLNAYAQSKVKGERLCQAARSDGAVANIVRFSSVYGCIDDHDDRVVPAFARAAAKGSPVRIEGSGNTLDFTHVSDVARGVVQLAEASGRGELMPAMHLVSGRGTTLRELARLAIDASGGRVTCEEHAPRTYDVAHFTGDPSLAKRELGWSATVPIEQGFAKLVDDYRTAAVQNLAPEALI